jgi:DNA-binding SARP family transcriptional activator
MGQFRDAPSPATLGGPRLAYRSEVTSGEGPSASRRLTPHLRVLLLGCLVVINDDGRELELPSAPLVRAILETLALRAGSVIQPWELVDAVWGQDPPATVGKSLQTYIGGLRRSLGSSTIQTVGGGYRLRVEADDVDLNRFERHIREGSDSLNQGDSSLAVESLSVALDLWRGEPLEELVDSAAGMAARARLSELHRVAEERLFEARLRLGEHELLVPDLEAAVRVEPFRERRWEQLMLALYRAGRQSDALDAFDRMLTVLDGHRLLPGEHIQALKTAIVARHPTLAPTTDFSRWCCHRSGAVGS